MTGLAVMAACFLVGMAAQRSVRAPSARDALWWVSYNLLAPLVAFAGFASVSPSGPLIASLVAVVIASWLVLWISRAYARWANTTAPDRAAVALAGGFGNTSFLGLPVAHLFYGDAGVVLMAVYAQLRWVLPEIAVVVATAETYGERRRTGALASLMRYLVNPPTIAALLTVALRLSGIDLSEQGLSVGGFMAQVVGPFGFLLLGLSLPLEPWGGTRLSARDLGALVIRHVAAPLCLLGTAAVLRVHLPAVFVMGAAMPCAFNLVVIARLFDVDAMKTRSMVLISTGLALGVILAASLVR